MFIHLADWLSKLDSYYPQIENVSFLVIGLAFLLGLFFWGYTIGYKQGSKKISPDMQAVIYDIMYGQRKVSPRLKLEAIHKFLDLDKFAKRKEQHNAAGGKKTK